MLVVSGGLAACGGGGGDNAVAGGPGAPNQGKTGESLVKGAPNSGPVQVSADDKRVWVVNPETDTVAVIDVEKDANRLLYDVKVGDEPRNLAISPDGKRVVVTNGGADTLSIIDATAAVPKVIETVKVGIEPCGLAFTPNGKKLYVANARSDTVSVLDGTTYKSLKTLDNVGLEPRGIAITNDGDDDDADEKVYVTQFLGVDRPGEVIGSDKYKEGRVAVIATGTDTLLTQAVLQPIDDTGFKSAGAVLAGIAPPPNPTDPPNATTGAFPNMLQAVAIKGSRAYFPNTCPSPDGPVRFNTNMQSCISVLDIGSDEDSGQTLNMNKGVGFEKADPNDERKRLFHAVPWAVAFKNQANEGYAVSLSSNTLIKVVLDPAGAPTINAPANENDAGGIVRVLVGQGPRGIAINGADTRAYVANENSRDLSIVDLAKDTVVATVATAQLPASGSDDARRLIGKAIFDSSSGVDLPQLSSAQLSGVVPKRRLSDNGWGSCYACHGFGKTDGVVWIFAAGPRRSLPLNGSFNPHDPLDQKILNYSGQNDEIVDFELNIRTTSGDPQKPGERAIQGLILKADGLPEDQVAISPFGSAASPPVNTGRSAQLDAMQFYVATGIRTPSSPLSAAALAGTTGSDLSQRIARGRGLFETANCASCHGGGGWSSSRVTDRPPKQLDATEGIAQSIADLRDVGTFDPTAFNEKRQNGALALGAKGYAPPSLLGSFGLGPYLHNGSALTLDEVMNLVQHRSAGTKGADTLTSAQDRDDMVLFLKSIDASTQPFPIAPGAAAP